MSQRYAKLYAKAAENPDIGELLEDDPLAVSLFFLAIARADVYGILPADPRRFRARVAPAAALSSATVAQSLHNLESHDLVRRYTASDGTELLHIVHYSDYQDVRWANRIGPPEEELPPWWEPPEAFLAYLESLDLSRVRGEDKRKKWVVLRECYCSATVALRENNPTQNTEHRTQNTEHRTQNTEDVNGNTNINDLTPPAAAVDVLPTDELTDDATPEPEPEPSVKSPRKPRTETPEQQAIHRLWDAFGLPGQPTPDKGEKPGYSAVLKLLQEHGIPLFDDLAAHVTADPTARLPDGAKPWPWFCKQVRSYLAAVWKWKPDDTDRPSSNGKLFIQLTDGTRVYSADWDLTRQYSVRTAMEAGVWDPVTGCTTEPFAGLCCNDGKFYSADGTERRWRQ